MSEEIKEINHHHNLCLFLESLGLDFDPEAEIIMEKQEWRDRYKVSLSKHAFHITSSFLPRFLMALEEGNHNFIIDELNKEDNTIKQLPVMYLSAFETITLDPSEPLLETQGLHFNQIDKRLSGLITETKKVIQGIAHMVNAQMDKVARNGEIVKDFDGVLTFTSELGLDFGLTLCFDKVKPIDVDNSAVEIQRTPFTPEDYALYMGEAGDKISARIEYINKLVKAFINSKDVAWNPECQDYAAKAINITILKAFLDQTITFVTFGGVDNWNLFAKENTPNATACHAIMDEEIEHVIKFLDSIEKPEGVDVFSIDLDTFGIFGRNKDNRVVTAAMQGYTDQLLNRYSQGFERLFTVRIGMNDNAHFFKA